MTLPCVLLLAALAAVPCRASQFAAFELGPVGETPASVASLMHDGSVVLRWRAFGDDDAVATVSNLAARLNRLAWGGLAPSDITVEKAPLPSTPTAGGRSSKDTREARPVPDALLRAKGELLLRLDPVQATMSHSLPLDLAELWARRLRAAFGQPYMMVSASKLRVPVGETRAVECGGRLDGPLQAESLAPEVVVAEADDISRSVTVRAVGTGAALVQLRAGRSEALLTALVRKWAAEVLEPIAVRITGPTGPNMWLPQAARVVARRRVKPEPGASVAIRDVSIGPEAGAAVIGAGGGGFFGFERRYDVKLHRMHKPVGEPVRAVLSNDPEEVLGPRLLARANLALNESINFLWHHVSRSSRRMKVVVRLCNEGSEPAWVHVIGADGGPSRDEVFVGHVVMQRFVKAWRSGSGSVFEVPPGQRCELSRRPMPTDQVVSGLAQITLLRGYAVSVESAAVSDWTPPVELEPLPASGVANPQVPTLELPGHKRLELRQQVGKGWSFLRIGKTPEDVAIHPRLRGEYGVVHDITVVFENADAVEAELEVALRSGGGPARGVIDVDGKIVETGLLRGGDEEVLYRRKTNGEARRAVRIRLIPQAGSNYPMTLIARSFVRPG